MTYSDDTEKSSTFFFGIPRHYDSSLCHIIDEIERAAGGGRGSAEII